MVIVCAVLFALGTIFLTAYMVTSVFESLEDDSEENQ